MNDEKARVSKTSDEDPRGNMDGKDKSPQPTAYVTVYRNQYPDDGFELGAVYDSKGFAENVVENQSDIDGGWERGYVKELEVR